MRRARPRPSVRNVAEIGTSDAFDAHSHMWDGQVAPYTSLPPRANRTEG